METMDCNNPVYNAYLEILRQELVPAMGCTEPIAIAYGAAKAREVLGALPEEVTVEVSGNIVKNAKSVTVPNTGGLKGIPVAMAAGIVAGDASRELEVISSVTDEQKQAIADYLDTHEIKVKIAQSGLVFDILFLLSAGGSTVRLRICHQHTNIVLIEKDGEILLQKEVTSGENPAAQAQAELLNVQDILAFVNAVRAEDIEEVIGRQIEYNSAIAAEGLAHDYGANIGSLLLLPGCQDIRMRAKAVAAAASDARMSGCELPVIILSGSGNQGITASLPVVEYANHFESGREKMLRAVALSDLLALHMKRYIGRLSAYCGVVCAGAASGAGIAWLEGGGFDEIAHTIVNALAIVSGMICDGAKPSCAAKIATAVEAGIMGYYMYRNGQQFKDGEGIVKKGVENTIVNVGRLGREGMSETDLEILRIMLDEPSSKQKV